MRSLNEVIQDLIGESFVAFPTHTKLPPYPPVPREVQKNLIERAKAKRSRRNLKRLSTWMGMI